MSHEDKLFILIYYIMANLLLIRNLELVFIA